MCYLFNYDGFFLMWKDSREAMFYQKAYTYSIVYKQRFKKNKKSWKSGEKAKCSS